jgi:hypothetical protein
VTTTTTPADEPRMPNRTRVLRPSLWIDASTGGLSAEAFRLYLGLATVADDAGYLLWRPDTLAAHFYRFLWPDEREATLKNAAIEILRAGLLEIYDCECIHLPYLKRDLGVHGGNHTFTVEEYHRAHVSTDKSVLISEHAPRQKALPKPTRVQTSTDHWASVSVVASASASVVDVGRPHSSGENDLKEGDEPEGTAITWLAAHGAALAPNGGKLHQRLCRLVEVHGADRVLLTFEEIAAAGEATEAGQFVLGASNVLNPIPGRRAKSAGDLLPTVKEAESAFERF